MRRFIVRNWIMAAGIGFIPDKYLNPETITASKIFKEGKMGIEEIENPYKKKETQPDKVWSNAEMDKLRRDECLCLNCARIYDDSLKGTCSVAKMLYNICVEHDMAMAITRCGATDDEGQLLYIKWEK